MKAKRGLSGRIIHLFLLCYSQADIAREVGCSRANVWKVLKARGLTEQVRLARHTRSLQKHHHDYLDRAAKELRVSIDEVVRALLVDAIDLAIEEAADLKCKNNTNALEDTPLLPKLQQLTRGSRRTPRTLSASSGPGHGSVSAGMSSAKSASA